MTSKKLLLAGLAASTMFVAGTASAGILEWRPGAANTTISPFAAPGTPDTYYLASEAVSNLVATSAGGTRALNSALAAGGASQLPSGNTTLTITLSNAVFNGAVAAGDVAIGTRAGGTHACAGMTPSISSGGANGSTTVVFVLSATGVCSNVNLNLDYRLTGAGDVTVSAVLATDSGTPIAPPQPTLRAVSIVDGFMFAARPQTAGGGLVQDVIAIGSNPPGFYRTLNPTDNILGSVQFMVGNSGLGLAAADINRDLASTPISIADVSSSSLRVTGDLNTFNQIVADGGVANRPVAGWPSNTAILGGATAAGIFGGWWDVSFTEGNRVMQASDYTATLIYALTPGVYGAGASFTESGPLQRIVREGSTVVIPWINSNSIYNSNPLQPDNIVRVGNNNTRAVDVYGEVLTANASAAGYTDQGVQLIGTAGAGGELVISRGLLTSVLGDFGRADVQLTIEAGAGSVTVRRFQRNNDGGFTEVSTGTVADDQR